MQLPPFHLFSTQDSSVIHCWISGNILQETQVISLDFSHKNRWISILQGTMTNSSHSNAKPAKRKPSEVPCSTPRMQSSLSGSLAFFVFQVLKGISVFLTLTSHCSLLDGAIGIPKCTHRLSWFKTCRWSVFFLVLKRHGPFARSLLQRNKQADLPWSDRCGIRGSMARRWGKRRKHAMSVGRFQAKGLMY